MFKLANIIMKGITMLGDDPSIESGATSVANYVVNTVKAILVPILGIVGAAGIIWAIVLGVQMARADSSEKRDEAKKRIIGLVVGIAIMIVLIVFFMWGLQPLLNLFVNTAE